MSLYHDSRNHDGGHIAHDENFEEAEGYLLVGVVAICGLALLVLSAIMMARVLV